MDGYTGPRYGQEVLNGQGSRGIVTEQVRQSGYNRGRVAVWYIGQPYAVSEWPEDLTMVDSKSIDEFLKKS